jgi:N-dimethylarginine dimethylaminohydrolase
MLDINIHNETGKLKSVIVGIANDFGGTPKQSECYDPKSIENIRAGTFPIEADLINELDGFINVLKHYGVQVFRPENIIGLNQIFARDIAFVIENSLIISNVINQRKEEVKALDYILSDVNINNIVNMPDDCRVEGGDVILCDEYIFVGYSEKECFDQHTVSRTNKNGLLFLQGMFPNKNIVGFELIKSDVNAKQNALHLDCCFQPIGKGSAIIYKEGFKNIDDINFLIDHFGLDDIIFISQDDMYNMYSNIFSISDNVIVSEKSFTRLNNLLRKKGFVVETVAYSETSKMEGLLRCSTMPLKRL